LNILDIVVRYNATDSAIVMCKLLIAVTAEYKLRQAGAVTAPTNQMHFSANARLYFQRKAVAINNLCCFYFLVSISVLFFTIKRTVFLHFGHVGADVPVLVLVRSTLPEPQ